MPRHSRLMVALTIGFSAAFAGTGRDAASRGAACTDGSDRNRNVRRGLLLVRRGGV